MSLKKNLLATAFIVLFFLKLSAQQNRSFNNNPFISIPGTVEDRTTSASNSNNTPRTHAPYRTIDGSNNNISSSRLLYGAAGIQLYREIPAAYAASDPKNAMNGVLRPSPRAISNIVVDEPVTNFNSRNLSTFVYNWGQFIDHDLSLTPTGNTEYSPVILPADEPLFTVDIPFFRSAIYPGTGTTNARQQSNNITSWIDASMVYGSDATRAAWLRTFTKGKLKTSSGNMLPWNTTNLERTGTIDPAAPTMGDDQGHTVITVVTGDIRGAEQPGLTSLHTLFVREHNRICDRLYAQGYRKDEDIYQKARKEVGALIEAITYQEFLPALGISLSSYHGYNSNVRPDVTNIFATAAYRIGHTMVADEVPLRDNNCLPVGDGFMDLAQAFNTPSNLLIYGIESIFKGDASHLQYETDNKINSVLRNFLFGNITDSVRFGLDLAALNIQRGRDHGLPDYNTIRRYYTGRSATTFADITSNTVLAAQLSELYEGSVNNVDAWVGLLAEDRVAGKSVGKTIHAILKSQFEKLRDGDYYFYLNDPYLPYATKITLLNTRLSNVIKRNTPITNIQSNVFYVTVCPGEDGQDKSVTGNSIPTGKTIVTGPVKEATEINNDFNIYPNPTSSILNIQFGKVDGQSSIEIFSANGVLVKSFKPSSNKMLQVDVSGFTNGIYIVNMINGKERRSLRFVKL
ncbi:MAG: peroxidase family protein [Ferruginibacter sp.]